MFNTLGNLAANPRAGLLFVDFEQGNTLQLTGQARVVWDPGRASRFVRAERVVESHLEEALEVAYATAFRWKFVSYSPFNPA